MHVTSNWIRDGLIIAGTVGVMAAILAPVVAGSESGNQLCVDNAHALITAELTYTQDYDERFPPMTTARAFGRAIAPYAAAEHESAAQIMQCPATRALYSLNTALSQKSLSQVDGDDVSKVVLFGDSIPHADGKSTVAFLDGHVERGGIDQANQDTECIDNLRQIGTATLQYTQDYDEQLPPYTGPADFKTLTYPYIDNSRVYDCPFSGKAYIPSPSISGKPLSKYKHMESTTWMIRDPVSHPDGLFRVVFLDGHVQRGGVIVFPTPAANPEAQCLSNVKRIGIAIEEYAQDFDEDLPPTTSLPALEAALAPYLDLQSGESASKLFTCPSTNKPYSINAAISGRNIADFLNPATVEVLRDSAPHPDGTITTLYLDGHATQKQP